MKAALNTNLFPIISVGMYCSSLDPDYIFDSYMINQDHQDGEINYDSEYFFDNFRNDLYVAAVQKTAQNYLDGAHEADGIRIEIEAGDIYSPAAYNFATDQIELTVKFDKTKVKQYAAAYSDEFDQFLHDHFTSYDGFHSHTANNYYDWKQDFADNNVQSIGAVLTFVFRDEIEDIQNGFLEACYGELYYSEFVDTTEIDEAAAQLESDKQMIIQYVRDNYQTLDVYQTFYSEFSHLDPDMVLETMKLEIDNIASHVLELDLV
jgi:hypothetical protein